MEHTDVSKEISKLEAGDLAGNPGPARTNTILLVDDSFDTLLITKLFLSNFGCVVHAFPTVEGALAEFDPKLHDLVVTDNTMPGMTGAEMAHIIKLRSPSTPVVMYSGNPPNDRSCLDMVIEKPAELSLLKEAVDRLLSGRPPGSIGQGP